MPTAIKPPERLIEHILQGECVAFVGAGFSMPAVPTWANLLRELADAHPDQKVAAARALLDTPRQDSRELEMAAQMLKESLGDGAFHQSLKILLSGKRDKTIDQRVARLRGIPFRAILTTNFDPFLVGQTPSPATYADVLRPKKHRWWDEAFWAPHGTGPRVVKLHGDVDGPSSSIVLGTRDYRRLLYNDAGYTSFLRAVFATSTVLYLGFSFTDAYLREIRSEVLAMLGHRPHDNAIDYAVMGNVPAAVRQHLESHDALHVLSYESKVNGQQDHVGFDEWLKALYQRTNPRYHLGRLLSDKQIVWVDAHPDNNAYGVRFLRKAASRRCVHHVHTWSEALPLIEKVRPDLILTHWGHDGATIGGQLCAVGERLLKEMRRQGLEVPVLVFSGPGHDVENRRRAMQLGAINYVDQWADLFSEMARVLAGRVSAQ